jgi:hypothetical protein
MRDLLYLLSTIIFFAIMLAYVRGMQRLGQGPSSHDQSR